MDTPVTVMEEFLAYLLQGLEVVASTLGTITFEVDAASFTLLDMTVYGAIISAVLSFINEHFSGSGTGKNRSISFKSKRSES